MGTEDKMDVAVSTRTTMDIKENPAESDKNDEKGHEIMETHENAALQETDEDETAGGKEISQMADGNRKEIWERNPRVERILALETEIRRQNEQEKLRRKRVLQEQEYINKMMDSSVEDMLLQTREERKYNEEFEEQVRGQVYRMHGLSEDKIEGMREYHNAWYRGSAFSLFFLSGVLFVLCGALHGFHTEICLFMAFYTAIGGTFLTNGKQPSGVLGVIVKGLYLLLFPAMMAVFVCYELQFPVYEKLLLALTIAGAVVLLFGVASYFSYDPYREDRKKQKKAERYLREIEKTALKEVRHQEKAFDKQERKRRKQEEKAFDKQERKGRKQAEKKIKKSLESTDIESN